MSKENDERQEQETIVRAVTFPVVEPKTGSWKEFRNALAAMWASTTQCSNWMMRECYARDVRRDGQTKLPAMPRVYLYPEARVLFPSLPAQCVAGLERAVQRKYRKLRYQIIWTSAISLPTFRYPTPFAIPNQSWYGFFDDGNRPIVSARIADKRWQFRLRGGARYRWQTANFRLIVDGKAKAGEAAIYRAHDGEILCKLVAHFEKPSAKALTGVLRVRTDRERLLVALDDKDERIWNLNFDHVKRWIAEYADQLERLRQDRKAEERPVPSFEARQTQVVSKQRRRMISAVQEAAAQVCHFAVRRKFSVLHYDDVETGYAPRFPWFRLRQQISEKCEDLGLIFEHQPGRRAAEETAEPPGEGEVE